MNQCCLQECLKLNEDWIPKWYQVLLPVPASWSALSIHRETKRVLYALHKFFLCVLWTMPSLALSWTVWIQWDFSSRPIFHRLVHWTKTVEYKNSADQYIEANFHGGASQIHWFWQVDVILYVYDWTVCWVCRWVVLLESPLSTKSKMSGLLLGVFGAREHGMLFQRDHCCWCAGWASVKSDWYQKDLMLNQKMEWQRFWRS